MKISTLVTLLASAVALTSASEEFTEANLSPLASVLGAENVVKVPESDVLSALESIKSPREGRVKGGVRALSTPRRDLKGGKGGPPGPPGPPAPPGGHPTMGTCDSVTVYYNKKQFKNLFLPIGQNAGGANAGVPIFDAKTGRKIAMYTEVSIAYGPKDCSVQGSWVFANNKQNKPSATLFTQSVCFATADAVVGGIGTFTCARGVAKRVRRGSRSRQFFEISVCAGYC